MLSQQEVLEQSKFALAQWEEKWRAYSSINGERYKKNGVTLRDISHAGLGKTCVLVGTGPSLERKIELLKQHRDKVDVICNDKCLGIMLDHDIKPDYVVLCDAGIDYDKWCEPYIFQTDGITLVSAIAANPKWSQHWKGQIYYFVNQDNIESEKIFSRISGCNEFLPAGSNVGNSSIIFAAMVLHYSRYLCIGYDFSWRDDDNYYAYNDGDKRYWMKHMAIIDAYGDLVNTSNNLYFSARWLTGYYANTLAPSGVILYDCSEAGIAGLPRADFKRMLEMIERHPITQKQKDEAIKIRLRSEIVTEQGGINRVNELLKTKAVLNIAVNYLREEDATWLKTLN